MNPDPQSHPEPILSEDFAPAALPGRVSAALLETEPVRGHRVSVAMATYNGAAYLPDQLDSLARQSFRPFELVVTDDGSTDHTVATVEAFARDAPFPVRLHRNPERLGYKANFLRAAGCCRGDLIAFCDQDDVWFERKLELAAAAFRDPSVILFHHEARIVRDRAVLAGSLGKTRDPKPKVGLLRSPPWIIPPGFTMVFRASLNAYASLWTESIDFHHPEQRESHDEWHFFLASVLGTIAYEARPLADYRQHGSNTFGRAIASVGMRQRLASILENRSDLYLTLARVARRRSEILARASAAGRSDAPSKQRLRDGARAWGKLAELYDLRAHTYMGTLRVRARAFRNLAAQGAYGKSASWSFRPKGLLKDLCLGVFAGPVVTRFGHSSTDVDWTCVAGEAN